MPLRPKKVSAARTKTAEPRRPRVSRTHKPPQMSLDEWQIELRRQFGREQPFRLVNAGNHPVFSSFQVTNPASGNTYTVRVRGRAPGDNTCTCADFATNTLGTCKHIEFTLARLEGRRDSRRQLAAGYQPPHSEIYLHYGSQREVRFRPGADCPVELARLAGRYFDVAGGLKPDAAAHFPTFLTAAGRLDPEMECGLDVLAYVAERRDADRRSRLVDEAFPAGVRDRAFDTLLKVSLYPYQREGALFAARAGRCLIADEMGLGKTIQALAAAEIMARRFGVERVLIICPTSLKHQWQREIERFTERPARIIGGPLPLRRQQFAEAGPFYKITNYDTVHADLDAINAWAPDLVILDEAQRIKNWTTRVARSVKKVRSPHAIVLTGTPLENRLEELVSIVQFVDLYRLGPTFRLLHDHQVLDEFGKVVGYRNLDRLSATLAPILIRRHKEQVLDQLPGRIENTVYVPMTEPQQTLHAEYQETVARIVAKWRKYRFLSEADQRRLMAALQQMRMVCDSTYLVDPPQEFGSKADEAATLLGELLERPGTKVVVFSQWLAMHELLLRRLKARGWGTGFFHGGLTAAQRVAVVDRFRDDPACAILLATDAGGVGLNLQHASVVINMDLPWTPAVLEQRIGRVHRLGQQRPVQVVHFVSKGGIEDGMQSVLKFKKSLFAGVLDGGEKEVFLGGSRLKRFMESVEAVTGAIPAAEPPEEPAAPEAPPPQAPPAAVDPWAGLIQAGAALLQNLLTPPDGKAPPSASAFPGRVCRDEATGESYLRLPVPSPAVVQQAVQALQTLLEGMRG
ncbi:MAG: DEAD/DEAH box helicase [Gemmataceae bacterium]